MNRRIWFSCLLVLLYSSLVLSGSASKHVDVLSYPKKTAECKAVNRKENAAKTIEISYVDLNPKGEKTILFSHGWPGLWSNWIHQIQEFKDEYHIISPNHRGFGESTHPGDIESSGNMGDIVGDLVCVLRDAGVDRAICVGHDWGSQVCWEAARRRPDIFEAVAGVVVPYIPASRWFFVPVRLVAWLFPRFGYQLYFQDRTELGGEELNKDIRRSIRAIYRGVSSRSPATFLKSTTDFLGVWDGIEIPPSQLLTPEEEDYLVEQYSKQGFYPTLQFYTYGNRYASWKSANSQGNHTIYQPALSVYPTLDAVADWQEVERRLGSAKYLPNRTVRTIPGSHWLQLENPVEFNAILHEWLNSLPRNNLKEDSAHKHLADEL